MFSGTLGRAVGAERRNNFQDKPEDPQALAVVAAGFVKPKQSKMMKRSGIRFGIMQIAALVIGISMCGCSSGGDKQALTAKQPFFIPPAVPSLITDPQQRIIYLAAHYWDNFDFADTALVADPKVSEQAFVDYLILLPHIPYAKAEGSLTAMMAAASTDSTASARFRGMAEHYLYDPNSPYRNEEYYIPVLRSVIADEQIDEAFKIRARYQLGMASKNRPGMIAADFTCLLSNGKQRRMSDIRADYTLLFFNNPDCHECQRVKAFIVASPVMSQVIKSKKMSVAALYPDEDIALWQKAEYPASWINARSPQPRTEQLYDLKAIPALYLLDKEKRIILKDAPVEQIEDWLLQTVGLH